MDIDGIIRELLNEHKKLDTIIRTLETKGPLGGPNAPRQARRGRKFMDSAGRREVSERMKRYWAKRREQSAPQPGGAEQARAAAA